MNIQKEELGNSQLQLLVEVEPDRLERAKQQAARQLAREVNVPGFRKGKAPYNIILRTVGERAILEEALEIVFPETIAQAIEQEAVAVYSFEDIEVDVTSYEPLTFRVIVPTMPVVKLGDLSLVEVDTEDVTVNEESVEQVLDDLRRSRAVWAPTFGPATYGDRATLDLRLDLVDGTTVADEKNVEILLTASTDEDEEGEGDEETPTPPNISEHLVGMILNQSKEFAAVYPTNWPEERLAGRTVLYRATLLDLKRRQEVELDDEFAQSVGDFKTLDELRTDVRATLLEQAEDEAFNRVVEQILDGLVDESELEYPQAMIKHEIERRLEQLERQLSTYGMNLERYLEITGKSREEMEDDLRDPAEEFVRRSLVVTEYIASSALTVSDEELDRELELLLQAYGPQAASLRERVHSDEAFMEDVRNRLLSRKAINRLYSEVTGEPEPPLFPEPSSEAEVPPDEAQAGEPPQEAASQPLDEAAAAPVLEEDPVIADGTPSEPSEMVGEPAVERADEAGTPR